MSDNVGYTPGEGATVAADEIDGVLHQRVKIEFGDDGVATEVSASNPMPVSGTVALDAPSLAALETISINGTVPVSGPLTDAQLRASTVPVTATSLDGTQLFSGTISATGAGAWIDTTGYSTLVMQISGTGQFLMYAEVSNDQTAVDYVLILSCDEVAFYDNIDSQGVYTVRPAARYIRYNVTQIVGSITGTIVGRTHDSISAVDMLTMAMDRAHGLPLHVSLDDMSLSRLSPSNQPTRQIGFYSGPTIVPINTLLMLVDVSLYRSIAFQYSVGTTGVLTPAWSNDGATWFTATLNSEAQAGSTTMSAGTGYRIANVLARYFRLLLTTATTAGLTQVILYGNPNPISTSPTTQPVSGTVTANIGTGSIAAGTNAIGNVGVELRATTGGHTYVRFVAAATTNLNALKASAGRLYNVSVANNAAYAVYCHFYNIASGSVTVGSSAVVHTLICPANSQTTLNFSDFGYFFSNAGWSVSVTKGLLDSDTTVTVANDFIFHAILA
jgi:hypothetical protein